MSDKKPQQEQKDNILTPESLHPEWDEIDNELKEIEKNQDKPHSMEDLWK